MTDSRKLAGLIGPVLVAVALTENPIVNPNLYDAQIPPLVYLSGTLLLIAGISIIRAHNVWSLRWPILITLLGWLAAVVGLLRMAFPHAYIQSAGPENDFVTGVVFALLFLGGFLTFKAHWSKTDD